MTSRFASNVARFCVPLTLAPPMVTIGQYGITVTEVIVLLIGTLLLLTEAPIASFMITYLLLFAAGWLGSLYGSFNWGIPIGPGNLSFLYVLMLSLCGYCVGRCSALDLREIATSRFTKYVVGFVALFAAAYPFLSPDARQLVMTPFINELFLARLASPRFPGIGLNANVYSFMMFVFFVFSFDSFLQRRCSWVIPFGALVAIVAAASRTVSVLTIGASFALLVVNAHRWSPRRWPTRSLSHLHSLITRPSRRRIFAVGALIGLVVTAAIIYGAQVSQIFALYARFQDMLGGGEYSGLATRKDVWTIGLERVKLSPFLGIPADPARLDPDNPLYFYTPHNEFLDVWTRFGILALFAHLFLVARMVASNVRGRAELPWLLLYGGMLVQMMVDSVFTGPRAAAFFFMIIGLNEKYLRQRLIEHTAARVVQPAPGPG